VGLFRRRMDGLPADTDQLDQHPDDDVPPSAVAAAPATTDWIANNEWQASDAPLHVVVGTSLHEQAFHKIAGTPRPGGRTLMCLSEMRREPDNQHDDNAIAVDIDRHHVGYVTGEVAEIIAPALDTRGRAVHLVGIPTVVNGGWSDAPNVGVWSWLDRPELRDAFPGIDWDHVLETYASWPVGVAPLVNTGHGRFEGSAAGFTGGTPRMPPRTEHYSAYVGDLEGLKHVKRYDDAETLLLALLDATEPEARDQGFGVAPWCYEQLAIVRHPRRNYDARDRSAGAFRIAAARSGGVAGETQGPSTSGQEAPGRRQPLTRSESRLPCGVVRGVLRPESNVFLWVLLRYARSGTA